MKKFDIPEGFRTTGRPVEIGALVYNAPFHGEQNDKIGICTRINREKNSVHILYHGLEIHCPLDACMAICETPKITAIVINEKGAYKHLNGHTLEVNQELFYQDLAHCRVVLVAPDDQNVDFKFKNVLFCDAQAVALGLYDAKNSGIEVALPALYGFETWAKVHGFSFDPEIDVPA